MDIIPPNGQDIDDIADELVYLVTVHEAGHALHLEHWGMVFFGRSSATQGSDLAAIVTKHSNLPTPVEHNFALPSIMFTPLSGTFDLDYDPADEMQFRVKDTEPGNPGGKQ